MNPRQQAYFRDKLLRWKEAILQEAAGHAVAASGRAAARGGPDRSRVERDRLVDRTAHPRPPAQADLQDRRGAAPDRRGRIWLLRSDRRADLARPARSAADRDDDGRGAGAARAQREGLARGLSLLRGFNRFDNISALCVRQRDVCPFGQDAWTAIHHDTVRRDRCGVESAKRAQGARQPVPRRASCGSTGDRPVARCASAICRRAG